MNKYEGLTLDSENESVNKFEQMDIETSNENVSQLKGAFYQTKDQEPEFKSEAFKLAQELKMPVGIVERNFDAFKRDKQKYVSTNKYEKLVEENPKLAEWLKNPENTPYAKNADSGFKSIEKLSENEDANYFQEMTGAMLSSTYRLLSGAAKSRALLELAPYEGLPAGISEQFEYERNEALKEFKPNKALYDNDFTKMLDAKAEQYKPKDMGYGVIKSVKEGNLKSASRQTGFLMASALPNLAMILASRGVGLGAMFASSAGSKYAENVEDGVPFEKARSSAIVSGGVEIGLESVFGVGSKGFTQAIKQMSSELGEKTTKEILTSGMKEIGKNFIGEFGEGAGAELVTSVYDYSIGIDDNLEGLGERVLESGIGEGVGGIAGGTYIASQRMMYQKIMNDNQAIVASDTYSKIGEAIMSPEIQNMPDQKQKEYVAQATKGTQFENIYIEAEVFEAYYQRKGISPLEMVKKLGIESQYNEAAKTSGPLKIPMADWLQTVKSGEFQELKDNVKFDEGAETKAEVVARNEKLRTEFEKQEKLAKESESQGSPIVDEVYKMLTEEIGMSAFEAGRVAPLYRTLEVVAKESGQDPMDLWRSYGLRIKKAQYKDGKILVENEQKVIQDSQELTEISLEKKENGDFVTYENAVLESIISRMGSSEAGKRGEFSMGSTFPEFMQNQGYNKTDVINAVEKKINGQELTEKQNALVNQLYEEFADRFNRGEVFQRDLADINTPEFREWFNGSKVVDDNGNPLVVYHGGPKDISEFKYEFTGKGSDQLGSGFYFSSDRLVSRGYGPNVVDVYLNIKNPLNADSIGNINSKQIVDIIKMSPSYLEILQDYGDVYSEGQDKVLNEAANLYVTKDGNIIDTLNKLSNDFFNKNTEGFNLAVNKVLGYDGIVKNFDSGITHYLAFFPNQIKSIYNKGSFSKQNNNIYYQRELDKFEIKEEFEKYPRPESVVKSYIESFSDDIKNVYDTAKNLYKDKNLSNMQTGISFTVSNNSLKKVRSLAGSSENKAVLLNLEKIISNAILENVQEPYNKDEDFTTKAYYSFVSPFIFEGVEYAANVVLARDKSGYKLKNAFAVKKNEPSSNKTSLQNALSQSDSIINMAEYNDFAITIKQDLYKIQKKYTNVLKQSADDMIQGAFGYTKDKLKAVIYLFKAKNKSTFLHESGHFFLDVIRDASRLNTASDRLKSDAQGILDYLGAESWESLTEKQIEKWARSFEAYLMEGKAPTPVLKKSFKSFQVWLTNIYKNIEGLSRKADQPIELNDEIRGVMDRMLASDEEIQAARNDMNLKPLLSDTILDQMGITEADKEKYREAIEQARDFAEAQLNSELEKDHNKKETAKYKERYKLLSEAIMDALKNDPIYKAIEDLIAGKEGIKLDKAQAINKYGKELVSKMPRKIFGENGMDIEVVGEIYGIPDFAKKLSVTKTLNEAVKLETEKLIEIEFPPVEITEEAKAAWHNEGNQKRIRYEMEFLLNNYTTTFKDAIRKTVRRMPKDSDVRTEAENIIGLKTTAEIKPYYYLRAEINAAKQAGIALSKGDILGAFDWKYKELLNAELYLASRNAEKDIKESVKKYKKQFKKTDEDQSKLRDLNLVQAAKAVLANYGVVVGKSNPFEFLEKMKSYDPEGFNVINMFVSETLKDAKPYEQVSYNSFLAMKESVDALWDLSKESKKMEIEGNKLEFETIKDELNKQIELHIKEVPKEKYDREVSSKEIRNNKLLAAKASTRRIESWADLMDLGKIGPFKKYIWQPVSDAVTKYRSRKDYIVKKQRAIFTEYKDIFSSQRIDADEIGYSFKNKSHLLMALLHSGNDSNKSKLLRGYGWGRVTESGELDSSNFDEMMSRFRKDGILTKRDYEFVQKIWDLMEEMKPDAQKAHKKMYGFYFNEITAKEIVNEFGTFRGGYVPAKADINSVAVAAQRQAAQEFDLNNMSFQFPTTGKGFTKSRIESFAARLSLDIDLLGSHIDGVLRFTFIEPQVKAVAKVIKNEKFLSQLSEVDSQIARFGLEPWLMRVAKQQTVLPSDSGFGKVVDQVASFLRSNASMQIMFFNTINTIQQATGISVAAVKLEDKNYLRGAMAEYIKNPKKLNEMILEKSEYMNNNQSKSLFESQQAIEKITADPSTFETLKEFSQKHIYFLQTHFQNMLNTVIWSAAYNEAIAVKGYNEKDAIRQADSVVRLTQGTNNPEDISTVEVGTATQRLFTQFYGYFNMIANLQETEMLKIYKTMGMRKGAGRMFGVYFYGFMSMAVLSQLIADIGSGNVGGDEDDEWLDYVISLFFGSQMRTATTFVPFAGTAANAIMARFDDKPFNDKLSLSPVISLLDTATGVPYKIYKGASQDEIKKSTVKDSLTTLGLFTGLPIGPLGKPVGYLMDVESGEAQPKGPVDFARGLITGQKGK